MFIIIVPSWRFIIAWRYTWRGVLNREALRVCLAGVGAIVLFLVEGVGRSEWIVIGRLGSTGRLRQRVLVTHGDGRWADAGSTSSRILKRFVEGELVSYVSGYM